MTDDNGASEGPYIHEHEHSCEYECLACAYAAGRKAERERCLDIVLDGYPCTVDIAEIQKRIRGGQDEK